MATSIKFCGFTNPDELKHAVQLGVAAVGLVFYDKSPRCVSVAQAQELISSVPPFVSVVALVVNMSDDELLNLGKNVAFDVIQFHGDETALDCQRQAKLIGKRWLKALRVSDGDTKDALTAQIHELWQHGASGVLLDAYHPSQFGGTGERFDWDKVPSDSPLPVILAGGLTPNNVAMALAQTHVAGVDVSGGIEHTKGRKDLEKMTAFVRAVHHAQ